MLQIRWFLPIAFGLILLLAACSGLETDTEPEVDEAAVAATATPEPTSTPTEVVDTEAESTTEEDLIETASGLQYVILEEGTGEKPQAGDIVAVHYTGTLEDGTQFDSSAGGNPIKFPLGAGRVIPGWDEGIGLLTVGSKARLVVPPDLAYGSRGAGGVIPPDATLIFEVELVEVSPGAPTAPTEVADDDFVTTDSGLKYYDLTVGRGEPPESGQQVIVHYTGWLLDGTKFDSSLDRGEPFGFQLGVGRVIPGWDEGVASMLVGGKRQLVIPPDLAYGSQGAGGVIPPDAVLIFEVELLAVQ